MSNVCSSIPSPPSKVEGPKIVRQKGVYMFHVTFYPVFTEVMINLKIRISIKGGNFRYPLMLCGILITFHLAERALDRVEADFQ